MRVLLIGPGAIGGLYSAALHRAGCEITVLGRSDEAVLRERGFRIDSLWGDWSYRPARVIHALHEIDSAPDLVLVCSKVLPAAELWHEISSVVSEHTAFLLIQNGLHIAEPWTEHYPNHTVVSALAFVCCYREGPAHIRHLDYGRLVLGNHPTGRSDIAESWCQLLRSQGIAVSISENILLDRWKKLVWNIPFNPVSVLAGSADTQTMLQDPECRRLIRELMAEVLRVAAADGYPIDESFADKMMEDTLKMKAYRTSMLIDYEQGRSMEVEAILGQALGVARQHRVSTPRMETLYALLRLVGTGPTRTHA